VSHPVVRITSIFEKNVGSWKKSVTWKKSKNHKNQNQGKNN
jgi:hypothetical protein